MKLLFKQRFFSWFDSYDIYDEAGNTADEYRLNAKSLLGMLMLKAAVGEKITITAQGDDAIDAVETLAKLI